MINCLLIAEDGKEREQSSDFNGKSETTGGQHLPVTNRGTKNNQTVTIQMSYFSTPNGKEGFGIFIVLENLVNFLSIKSAGLKQINLQICCLLLFYRSVRQPGDQIIG